MITREYSKRFKNQKVFFVFQTFPARVWSSKLKIVVNIKKLCTLRHHRRGRQRRSKRPGCNHRTKLFVRPQRRIGKKKLKAQIRTRVYKAYIIMCATCMCARVTCVSGCQCVLGTRYYLGLGCQGQPYNRCSESIAL